ncbi:hypothetical protein ABZP36_025044 [Zizania latifolia]
MVGYRSHSHRKCKYFCNSQMLDDVRGDGMKHEGRWTHKRTYHRTPVGPPVIQTKDCLHLHRFEKKIQKTSFSCPFNDATQLTHLLAPAPQPGRRQHRSSRRSTTPLFLADSTAAAPTLAMAETVVLRVGMSCQGCVGAVKRVLGKMEGVESFDVDIKEQKVTVKGNVTPDAVLQTVSKTGKKTSFWEAGPASNESTTPALS